MNILNELKAVLNFPRLLHYKTSSENYEYSHGWFPITDYTRINYVNGSLVHGGRYYCIEIKYPNKDELKFKIHSNNLAMQARYGFINLFKFKKVQHCKFTPDLNEDMYMQYMFMEDHWEFTYEEYKIINEIYNRIKPNLGILLDES